MGSKTTDTGVQDSTIGFLISSLRFADRSNPEHTGNVAFLGVSMIDEALEEKLEEFSDQSDQEAAKLFYEFKYRTVMEAATKLTQFALIFFSISSLITAITVFNDFDDKTRDLVFYSVLILVAVFSVIGVSIMYGVITGLVQIRETLKSVSAVTYEKLNMDAYFKRGIRVLFIVSAASVIGVLAIIALVATYS